MKKLKVFVVEDDATWQGIYKHNIEKPDCDVTIVGNKVEAFDVLEKASFDFAILDVRLDKVDDQNIDGLLVLQRISKLQEGTRSIVVTGHGTVKITRDALQNYGAADIREKEEINPQLIRDIINQQIVDLQKKLKPSGSECAKLLSGKENGQEILAWESWMQNILKSSGGIDPMYELFQKFVGDLVPIFFSRNSIGLRQYQSLRIVSGYVWSKRFAQAIGIFIGNEQDMASIKGKKSFEDLRFDWYPCSTIVFDVVVGDVSAAALSIPDMPFSNFK